MNHPLLIVSAVWMLHSSLSIALAFPPAPVARTGQTISYAVGDDGAIQAGFNWPKPRFTDNGDGTVTDNLTELIWLKNANCFGNKTRSAANTAVNTLATGFCGLSDGTSAGQWRLPNRKELKSLVDHSQHAPALSSGHPFTSVQYAYWTSTRSAYAYSDSGDWHVWMDGGTDGTNYSNSSNLGIWPVRAGHGTTLPSPRFNDNGNGTISDNLTGLIWLKMVNCVNLNWANALTWSNNLASGMCGLSDNSATGQWRLPNITELESLVDTEQYLPALPSGHPFTISNPEFSQNYWSSTSSSSSTGLAVSMYGGGTGYADKSASMNLFAVRAGQFWTFDSLIISTAPKFGTLLVSTISTPSQVEIINRSSSSQPITDITISGANASEFSIILGGSNPCANLNPTLVEGSSSCTLLLEFTPTSIGEKAASLDIAVNGTTNSIPLIGAAISTLYGTVINQSTGLPVSGSTVTLNTGASKITGTTGTYNFGSLPVANYSISVAKTGHQTSSQGNLAVTATTSAQADILLPTVGTFNITSSSLPWASPNVLYSSRVMVAGGTAPYTFSRPYGTLPTGLSLDITTGTISGTPTGTGSYTFAIGVTDNVAGYSEKEFTIELLLPLQVTTPSLPSGRQGVSYNSTITATGGKPAYSFTLTEGTLPLGLTLGSNGALSGTSRESGTFNIKVKLTDSTGRTYDKSYTLSLTTAVVLTLYTTTLPQGYIGTGYSTTLSASGGVPSRTFSVTGTLPTGLSLNSSTGVISGTPSSAGLTNLTFTVTDYSYPTGQTASVTIPLRIWNALSIATTTIPDGTQITPYSTTLSGSGGAVPRSWSLASGTLPQGITLDSTTGTIAGTPAICGSFPFTTRLTDSAAVPKSVDKPLTLNIACFNGYIISGNAGVGAATVSYSGTASGTVTADDSGNYTIGPLLNGTYTVTPSKPLYIFTPASRTVTVNLDLSIAAFTAAEVPAKPGDCDGDNSVSIAEVQNAINMFLGLKAAVLCVDIDNQNGVSIAEVQKAINSFLGL